MRRKQFITHAFLWAAAIIAAAIVGAPSILSTVLLPALWIGSLLVDGNCRCHAIHPSA